MKILSLLLTLAFSLPIAADTDDKMRARLNSLYGESEIYERFFDTLKNAIVEEDIQTVARLNQYPVRVNFQNGTEFFNTEQEFIEAYSGIITAEMVAAVKRQRFSDLFANSYGLHIGAGSIWFQGVYTDLEVENPCNKVTVKVITYNVNKPRNEALIRVK